MSLFTKANPWIVAAVMATNAIFGQNGKCNTSCAPQKSFDQAQDMKKAQMMAAYNAPSRIEVRGTWDVYTSASFTYWQPVQDNMELGVVSTATSGYNINGNVVNANFDYQPGFKIALGLNIDHDNWDTNMQYTWFRGTQNQSTSLVAKGTETLFPMRANSSESFYSGSEKWKIHMDLLDWELARCYFVGTKLTFRPFMAARAAWIRQNLSVNYSNEKTLSFDSSVHQKSQNWGIGPRTGVYTNWLIGEGFRFYGNAAGDVLFTQFTKNYSKVINSDNIANSNVHQKTLNTLRTHVELELGFGWESYFDNNNWHVDLTAGYGFQTFFDQNMFRNFSNSYANSNSPNGNLYMHGLTATARFDF